MSSNLTLSDVDDRAPAILAKARILASLCVLLLSPGHARAAVNAPALYRAALSAMQRIEEPAFLTYRTTIPSGNATIVISRGDDDRADLAIVSGSSPEESWDVAYRTEDGVASIQMPDGTRLLSRLAIFDPTWRGAFAWLRYGLGATLGSPLRSAVAGAGPLPAPTTSAPPVIAMVTAIDEDAYRIRDGGRARCPDGSSGRRLWTIAKRDPMNHPMIEAIVAIATQRFCAMRFHEHLRSPSVTFDLDVDLHFGTIGGFYLITGGIVSGAVRPYRRPGWFQMHSAFDYDRFAFPESLPPTLFAGEPSSR